MTLTKSERDAVSHGDAVPIVVDGTDCVILRRDVYERAKRLVDDLMDPEDAYPSTLAAWDAVGSPEDAEDYKS